MIEVKITVEAPGLTEALFKVASAIEHRADGAAQPKERKQSGKVVQMAGEASSRVSDAQPVQQQPPQPQPVQQPQAAQSAQVTPAQALAQEQPQAAQSAQQGSPTITLETLSRAGAALIDAGMLPQVMQTIQKYGVATITQLKPDVYPSLAADLRALGAQI